MFQIMHFLRRIPISYASKSSRFFLATMGKKRKKVLRRVCGECEGVSKVQTYPLNIKNAQSPDFLKPGLCYVKDFLYLCT